MNWYKKKKNYVIVLLAVWSVSVISINKEYKVSNWKACQIGESYDINDTLITWKSMELMNQDEILKKFPDISQRDILENRIKEDDEYLVINVLIKNLSQEEKSLYYTNWEVQCGSYANGVNYLTSALSQEEKQQPDSENDIWVLFRVGKEDKKKFLEKKIKIYTSLYPKRIYLEGYL